MKFVLTHLLAVSIGALAVLLIWRPGADETADKSSEGSGLSHGSERKVSQRSDRRTSAGFKAEREQREIEADLSMPVAGADLTDWVESRKGDERSYAEALAGVAVLTNDGELLRKAIETGPENPHLHFLGANSSNFPDEERLEFARQFFLKDPDNSFAGYLYAAKLLGSGAYEEALEVLKAADGRSGSDDFSTSTQLLIEDALMGVGFAPAAAKIRSLTDLQLPHFSELSSFVESLNGIRENLAGSEAEELQGQTASMARRLASQAKSSTVLGHLVGLNLEKNALEGLADDDPSPYEGLTAGEVREEIAKERAEIRELVSDFPDVEELIMTDPELAERYVDRFRLVGELNAAKWLRRTLESRD